MKALEVLVSSDCDMKLGGSRNCKAVLETEVQIKAQRKSSSYMSEQGIVQQMLKLVVDRQTVHSSWSLTLLYKPWPKNERL